MIRSTALLVTLAFLAPGAAGQATRGSSSIPAGATQHLVVVTDAPDTIQGRLFRMERGADGWSQIGGPIPVVVGRSGVGPKREGDGRSPQGVFELGPAFGYAPQPPARLGVEYRGMAPGTVCVDDSRSAHYNRIVNPARLDGDPDWGSSEAMRRDLAHGDDLYRYGVEVLYNRDQEPGAGSCIFLHVWRGPQSPTAGCTAMPERALLTVLSWLRPGADPVLIQGTEGYLRQLRAQGALPYPVPGTGEG